MGVRESVRELVAFLVVGVSSLRSDGSNTVLLSI